MGRWKDLTGLKIRRWTVLEYVDKDKYGNSRWRCRCDCGTERIVNGTNLMNKNGTFSCGCYLIECLRKRSITHGVLVDGKCPTEYSIWHSMISRCENKNTACFHVYGGRGIKVCDRWRNSFENFLEDMGSRPSKYYSLDRINNDGNYEPDNCRWATRKEQFRNISKNLWVVFNGERMIMKDFMKKTGITSNHCSSLFYDKKMNGDEIYQWYKSRNKI